MISTKKLNEKIAEYRKQGMIVPDIFEDIIGEVQAEQLAEEADCHASPDDSCNCGNHKEI